MTWVPRGVLSVVRYYKVVLGLLALLVIFPIKYGFSRHLTQNDGTVIQPIVVSVSQVGTSTIPNKVPALGSLSAIQQVTISAEVDGRISAIYFTNGSEVAKGMPIIQLDNQKAKADYQSAVTDLQLDQSKYERSAKLVNEAVSQQDLDTLKAEVAQKQANVQNTLTDLNQKQVDAPFAGVVGAFQVQTGAYIKAGDPIVTLVNTDQLRADYNISESLLPELKMGQLVELTVSTYPNQIFYGTVNYISPMVDQSTRTVEVQALVPNPKHLLSPGMFVRIMQQISTIKDALVIPEQAMSADVKGYFVYKVVGNKVAQTYIQVGARLNGMAQISKGLQAKDVIVTAGQQKLQDGSTIYISSQAKNK